ncbi:zinc-finger double domain-containing protein [Hirsutella rhossiliensis]|uniref:Zinc-finger double domain-containing protein n=1 Tax=Hirsutella rhossiliensis TaxID=111463 RepID=A0A9P8SJA7_9HYPO|nr:zinc-finger double domain-containing protein [Hirsutella rhossiliensis]KAH0965103.1 zinc-finger double domain-containing protein [Hirsutella rhossiliensis]
MMDAPTFLPYDSRSAPAAHMQRPLPPQYVVAPAYNSGHMSNPPPHHYPNQQAFAYVPYQSPPPSTPVGSPYRHDAHERLAHGHKMPGPDSDGPRTMPFRRDSRHTNEVRLRSPSARSESQVSTARSVASNPTANSKSITYNETINPADRINFETDVDELMKVIQDKEDREDGVRTQAPTPAQTPNAEPLSGSQSPVSTVHSSNSRTEPKPKKKWVCDGPNCNKRFVQKTHLDIHRRTHTGQKPYVCTKDNCGLTFSQRGNLKTHMRRHTGEKPYSCSICGKLFAQRGNVRSHEETHKGLKPFICRLDDCNKTFSQLGNMKTHQNNFHKETLQRLTDMFIKFAQMGEVPEEHQELFEYFKVHYKNSNKGIKGRGKARTVAPKSKGGSQAPSSMAFPHLPMPTQQPAYVPGPSNSLASIPRHHPTGNCGMFEQHHGNGGPGILYEDEHARQMAFSADRLY